MLKSCSATVRTVLKTPQLFWVPESFLEGKASVLGQEELSQLVLGWECSCSCSWLLSDFSFGASTLVVSTLVVKGSSKTTQGSSPHHIGSLQRPDVPTELTWSRMRIWEQNENTAWSHELRAITRQWERLTPSYPSRCHTLGKLAALMFPLLGSFPAVC